MSDSFRIENISNYQNFIPQVADWIHNEFISGKTDECSKDELIKYITSRSSKNIPMTFICLLCNKCIGTISLFRSDLKELENLTPWLAALYVDVDFRKMGIAKLLINKIEEVSLKLGYNKIYLRTETGQGFYEQLGWIKILDTVDEYNQNINVLFKDIIGD